MIALPEDMVQNPYVCLTPDFKGVILEGMEEVIGRLGVHAVLNLTGLSSLVKASLEPDLIIPYHGVSDTQDTLEQLYGRLGGRGLALKAGRACFNIALRQYGQSMGLLDLDFRLLPASAKIRTGLQRMARFMNGWGDPSIRVEEDARSYRWIVANCPLCWGRKSDVPVCSMQVGMLQEYFYWASAGKNYCVVETECSAMGAKACVFEVDKAALD